MAAMLILMSMSAAYAQQGEELRHAAMAAGGTGLAAIKKALERCGVVFTSRGVKLKSVGAFAT
jgi:hypothetical protein